MPTIEVSYHDLCRLIGKNIPFKELSEKAILYAKGEIDEVDGDSLKIDIKDTNRPDLWSAEGIAREIKGRYGYPGLPEYPTQPSGLKVIVDRKMKSIRPYTVCAVVKDLDIDEHVLSQMIQLQEKVSITFGRNRKEVAIGVYDFNKITPPIKFTAFKPKELRFVPLEFKKEMTLDEILKEHPKGKEYGHLLQDLPEYPIFIDANQEVLSMPPIINSDYTGKVTQETRDLFIECSGFNLKFLMPALNVIVTALAERGGKIETVEVVYPDRKLITPDLSPKRFSLNPDYVRKISGLNLSTKDMCMLLEQARYKTSIKKEKIELLCPAYRQDIMHERDVVEDIIISYGYNKVEPIFPKLFTIGSQEKIEEFGYIASEIMIGMGFQEIMSYTLTNKNNLFGRMLLKESQVAEIENPVSSNWCVFRNWLLPSLMEFLSKNKHREYPQKIFEIGDVVIIDHTQETKTRNPRKLACAITDTKIGYEDVTSVLDAFFRNLNLRYTMKKIKHSSFISGRVASIFVEGNEVGFIGEVHPQVLNNWELEKPVAAFEIDLSKILDVLD
ncbi:MAG: phenylalanine--tRNA ligase subunit beta [Candidatus Aenigmatarchaeota archaeon]|nr:MAG: phenylalanine--tRNA ligase subunit beta [Candidatus Aenigmarchaeota archaeon]